MTLLMTIVSAKELQEKKEESERKEKEKEEGNDKSGPLPTDAVYAGYLTKRGARFKSWKKR